MQVVQKYVLKLYQKCEHSWLTLTKPLTHSEVLEKFLERTNNKRINCEPKHGDYYKIFPINIGVKITKI